MNPQGDQTEALRALVRQAELAGASRRALLLHTDRLPPMLAKPHHQRLARAALDGLAVADRARVFALPRGRLAIVWRSRDGRELDHAMTALAHLMEDLPEGQGVPPGQLVSVYDLPDQGAWLLDELAEPDEAGDGAAEPALTLDIPHLARLELALAQADMTSFMRWRPVVRLAARSAARNGASPPARREVAWEERYIAVRDVAAALCPGRRIKADRWLFQRLSRSLDRRLLALLTGPQALRGSQPFALHMNVATILSPEFLRFDAALPGALRGAVTLYLTAADILADAGAFCFARNFAKSRGYALLLRGATAGLLALFDVAAAEFDYVQVPFSADLHADPDQLQLMLPRDTKVVLAGAEGDAVLAWAVEQGFALARQRVEASSSFR